MCLTLQILVLNQCVVKQQNAGDSLKFLEDGSGGKVLRYRPKSSEALSLQQVSKSKRLV